MIRRFFSGVILFAVCAGVSAQNLSFEPDSNLESETPRFKARFSIGFNYDLLRPPTRVSFEYPRGYFGMNLPLTQSADPLETARKFDAGVDSIFSDTNLIDAGKEFKPSAAARQNPNTTFRVDVPMLGGVCSFSNIQNVFMNYNNTLGLPSTKLESMADDSSIGILMRGAINVPMEIGLSWETMSFGYAYRVNRNFIFALNLHRHIFLFDVRSKINIDLLGRADVEQGPVSTTIPLNYALTGVADAHYATEAWTPSLGAKIWRFTWTSRFGLKTQAKGWLKADYTLPFFMDPETFEMTLSQEDLADPATISRLQANETVRFTHEAKDKNGKDLKLDWEMPSGHTIGFDIIPEKLGISYTKFSGQIHMGLENLWRYRNKDESDSLTVDQQRDTVNLDFSMPVDNIMLLSGTFRNAFFHVGLFTLDFSWADQENLLSGALGDVGYPLLGGAPIVPILTFGSAIGSKLQLALELDVLPLIALKTGINYYF